MHPTIRMRTRLLTHAAWKTALISRKARVAAATTAAVPSLHHYRAIHTTATTRAETHAQEDETDTPNVPLTATSRIDAHDNNTHPSTDGAKTVGNLTSNSALHTHAWNSASTRKDSDGGTKGVRRERHVLGTVPRGRLFVVRPDLVDDWVPELNAVDVCSVHCSSGKVVWWRCGGCRAHYSAAVRTRVACGGQCCPHCHGTGVVAPELRQESSQAPTSHLSAAEDARGAPVHASASDAGRVDDGHSCAERMSGGPTEISGAMCATSSKAKSREASSFGDGARGVRQAVGSSLADTHPVLATRWDARRNGLLRPTDVDANSTRNVWWLPESTERAPRRSFARPVRVFVRDATSPSQHARAHAQLEWSLLERIRSELKLDAPAPRHGRPNRVLWLDEVAWAHRKRSWSTVDAALQSTRGTTHTLPCTATAEALAVQLWCEDHAAKPQVVPEPTLASATAPSRDVELRRGGPPHDVDTAVRAALLNAYATHIASLHHEAAAAAAVRHKNDAQKSASPAGVHEDEEAPSSTKSVAQDRNARAVRPIAAAVVTLVESSTNLRPQPERRAVLDEPEGWVRYFTLTTAHESILRSACQNNTHSGRADVLLCTDEQEKVTAHGDTRVHRTGSTSINMSGDRVQATRKTMIVSAGAKPTGAAADAHAFPPLPTMAELWRGVDASSQNHSSGASGQRRTHPQRAMSARDSCIRGGGRDGNRSAASLDHADEEEEAILRSYPRFLPHSAYIFEDNLVDATPVETAFPMMHRHKPNRDMDYSTINSSNNSSPSSSSSAWPAQQSRRRKRYFLLDPRRQDEYHEDEVIGPDHSRGGGGEGGDVITAEYDTDAYRHATSAGDVEGAVELAAELRAEVSTVATGASTTAQSQDTSATSLVNLSIAALGENQIAAADTRALHQQSEILSTLLPSSSRASRDESHMRRVPLAVDEYYHAHVDRVGERAMSGLGSRWQGLRLRMPVVSSSVGAGASATDKSLVEVVSAPRTPRKVARPRRGGSSAAAS